MLRNPDSLVTVPDSGAFIAYNAYETDKDLLSLVTSNMYKLANVDALTPMTECNKRYVGEEWKCLYLNNSFTEITAPMLLINSEYDSWAITNSLQIKCLTKGQSGYTLS